MALERPLLVAEFGAPHGTRGEIRLKPMVEDPDALVRLGPLHAADGRTFRILSLRPAGKGAGGGAGGGAGRMMVARVDGLRFRDEAAALTRLELFLDRSALPDDTEEDEFYATDLVGCTAVDADGATIGEIVAVPDFGAGDLLEITRAGGRAGGDAGGTLLVAFTRANVPEVDLPARRVRVDVPGEVSERDGE